MTPCSLLVTILRPVQAIVKWQWNIDYTHSFKRVAQYVVFASTSIPANESKSCQMEPAVLWNMVYAADEVPLG
jgi:hypothetical protein